VDGDLIFSNAGDWGPGFADRVLLASILACVALADARASDTGTESLAVASGQVLGYSKFTRLLAQAVP
jgi:hypothetical protein